MLGDAEMSVEMLVRRRRRVVLGFVVAWGLWQATRVIGDFTDDGRDFTWFTRLTLYGVQFLSWLAWTICLVCLLLLGRKLRGRPALAAVLGDELFRQTRLRATMVAFFCTVGCQAALIFASHAWRLSATEGADISILVAVTSFLGVFLWMERE